jgi:hypothetical protein
VILSPLRIAFWCVVVVFFPVVRPSLSTYNLLLITTTTTLGQRL